MADDPRFCQTIDYGTHPHAWMDRDELAGVLHRLIGSRADPKKGADYGCDDQEKQQSQGAAAPPRWGRLPGGSPIGGSLVAARIFRCRRLRIQFLAAALDK